MLNLWMHLVMVTNGIYSRKKKKTTQISYEREGKALD